MIRWIRAWIDKGNEQMDPNYTPPIYRLAWWLCR